MADAKAAAAVPPPAMADGDDGETQENLIAKFQTLSAEADLLAQRRAFTEAIQFFTRALEIRPKDKHCLVCRSQCLIQIGAADAALKDAEAALKESPEFFKAILQKAEALYAKGDFELALMHFHRGNRLRPELNEFRVGIQKAREAIENSIGRPRAEYKVSPFGKTRHVSRNATMPTRAMTVNNGGGGGVAGASGGGAGAQSGSSPSGAGGKGPGGVGVGQGVSNGGGGGTTTTTTTTAFNGLFKMSPSMESKLLGELYEDKCYLQSLISDKDFIDHPDTEVVELVTEGLRYLSTRVEFWRQQHPLYACPRVKRIKPRLERFAHVHPRKDNSHVTENSPTATVPLINRTQDRKRAAPMVEVAQ